MKLRILFLLPLLAKCVIFDLKAQDNRKFVISGTVDSLEQGNVILQTKTPVGNDTLCVIPIIDGRFKGEGDVRVTHMAEISVQGYPGYMPIMLSPGETYFVNLCRNDKGYIKSEAPLQQAFEKYVSLVRHYNNLMHDTRNAIEEARQNKKI